MVGERDLLQKLSGLLHQSASLKAEQRFAEATALVGDGCRDFFGFDRRFLQMMQPAQVAAMLTQPRQVWALAQLLSEEADVLQRQGDQESAAATAGWILAILVASGTLDDGELVARLHGYSLPR